jgi:hypothetical protein
MTSQTSAERGYRLPSAAEILREPCPFCGADLGEPCSANVTSGKYRVMKGFHAKRMRLARYIPLERMTSYGRA